MTTNSFLHLHVHLLLIALHVHCINSSPCIFLLVVYNAWSTTGARALNDYINIQAAIHSSFRNWMDSNRKAVDKGGLGGA